MHLADTIVLTAALLFLGVIFAALFRRVALPYTVLLVILGLALQFVARHFPQMENFRLTPNIILLVFLPILVFEAGQGIKARQLAKDLLPILVLAIPALIISTSIIGFGVSWLAGIPLVLALVFGALISATDPVAVIALFKELGVPRRLTTLVEGESLFNDATAIVLFHLLLSVALLGHFSLTEIPTVTVEFIKVFFGGALIGAAFGLAAAVLANSLKIAGANIILLTISLAYASFIVAEHEFHVSGVMATVVSALICSMMINPRISESEQQALHVSWDLLSNICNTLLFILIGFSISISGFFSILFILLSTIVFVLFSRALVIYTLVPLTVRIFKLPLISKGEQHIMWWGGLKGGLAIAMVLSIPESIYERQLLIDMTAGVVLFTLLVNAPSVRLLIQKFGLDSLSDYQKLELDRGLMNCRRTISHSLNELGEVLLIDSKQIERIKRDCLVQLEKLSDKSPKDIEKYTFYLKALQWEIAELEKLYRNDVVRQITYLDALDEKFNRYELIAREKTEQVSVESQRALSRFSDNMIARLREKDWAAWLMDSYLDMRLEEHLKKNTINFIICNEVLEKIEGSQNISPEVKQELLEYYGQQIRQNQMRMLEVKQEFPDLYNNFESELALRVSLKSARTTVSDTLSCGDLGGKTVKLLSGQLDDLNSNLHMDSVSESENEEGCEHLRAFSLFSSLSDDVLEKIWRKSTTVHYLEGDVVIAGGDVGNAIYLVEEGRLGVKDRSMIPVRELAVLEKGDFFGEMGLLEKNRRTVNVEAMQACVLIRVGHKVILELDKEHPEIMEQLRKISQERQQQNN